jgi:PAS domain S-box-containing protein
MKPRGSKVAIPINFPQLMANTSPPPKTPPVPRPATESDERFRRLVEGVQDYGIFLLDATGHVASWNAGARRLKGYEADEIIGKHFSIFYPPEAKAMPAHELKEATRLGRFEDEGWRLRKDGTRFWANVVITALYDDDGVVRAFSKITRDLTERKQHEERLRQSEERFRLLLEGVEDTAVFMLDAEGQVTSWNTGAQKILGYRPEEIIGRSFELFFPRDDVEAGRPAEELRTATLNRRAEERGWRVRKDGTRFWADVVVTSLHDDEGRLRGFAKVTRDLSERKRMETLEEQGRHLTEFLAMLAHELRNPLAPIRNAAAILGMSRDASPQIAWCREVIERQALHLTRLVDDLLDVSRITRGKLRLEATVMDVNAAVQRAVEAVQPFVDQRGHRLHLDLREKSIAVNGDMTRLTQVLINLLNNAAKYTPEGGNIWVEAFSDGRDAVVRIRDSGVGIAPQLLERVFDLFTQGERTLDRSEGGLGIGLTLARRIAQLHGGSITAKSKGLGTGSEFTVRLPRLDLVPGTRAPSAELTIATGAARHSVLVVDDNVDSASTMAMLLRMAGHKVEVEHDGPAALECAAAERPDVVLLDIGLPGMSGYEVAKYMRAHGDGQALRIYAMTGYATEDDRKRSRDAGFDGHLVKPVVPEELLALIDAPREIR